VPQLPGESPPGHPIGLLPGPIVDLRVVPKPVHALSASTSIYPTLRRCRIQIDIIQYKIQMENYQIQMEKIKYSNVSHAISDELYYKLVWPLRCSASGINFTTKLLFENLRLTTSLRSVRTRKKNPCV
jgi:hypothetical protein